MRIVSVLIAVALTMGCEGLIEDAHPARPRGTPSPTPRSCIEAPIPAPTPMRRLSSEQYGNVLGELVPGPLGGELRSRSVFPETRIDHGFANDAEANTVSTAESNAIEDNAEALANYILTQADTAIPALTGCVSSGFSDAELSACVGPFIDRFAERAYRRPITEGERTILRGVFDSISATQGARGGFAAMMQLFFQAPALLYQVERGDGTDEGGALRLSGYELATRLSFFLRNSSPDEELLTAAREGRLREPAEIAAQASRLVASDSFMSAATAFHRDWLHAYEVGRDTRTHPLFSPAVQGALTDEMGQFVRWLFTEGDGRFATLMTTGTFSVAAPLAGVYGVSGASVAAPNRFGILTLASVQAAFAREDEVLTIRRGAFVREAVLCGGTLILPPEVDIDAARAETAHLATARERLEPLVTRGDCVGCHSQINPIGLGFENYDNLGVWRDTERGAPIDASGSLVVGTVRGEFSGPQELAQILASSEVAMSCYATHMYRFAMGRREAEADRCTLETIQREFIASGGDIRALMTSIATSHAFTTRAPTE